MAKQLGGWQVSEDMYRDYETARRAKRPLYLTRAVPGEGEPEFYRPVTYCTNCDSTGVLFLSMVYAGPFKTIPPHARERGVGEDAGAVLASPHWIDGQWWLMSRKSYTCPVCNGSGKVDGVAARKEQEAEMEVWF